MDNISPTSPNAESNLVESTEKAHEIVNSQKPKQYILMVNDISMLMLSKMFHGLQFLEVEGMNIKDDPTHMLMVTPILEPISENAPNSQLEPHQEG